MERTVYTSTHIWLRLDESEQWNSWNDKGLPFRVQSVILEVRDDDLLLNKRVLIKGRAIKADGTVSRSINREMSPAFVGLPGWVRDEIRYRLAASASRHAEGRVL